MIKVSDFIAKHLKECHGFDHIFLIAGGGAMHLNDSFGKHMKYTCNHHEQASAIAAEGYAQYSGKPALVNVTTGPGGINTLNGVFGQWTDSVPVIYISGQVKFETTINSCPELKLRQLGDQEVDIIKVVSPLLKYAASITDPLSVKKIIDKAVHLAVSGRPGPVWVDVPMNIQGALVDENLLENYEPFENLPPKTDPAPIIREIERALNKSTRPVIIAGHGIRISKTEDQFIELTEKLKIPVLTSLRGMDLIDENNDYYIGRIGTIGQRAGNFALQNADLILALGTRNNIRQVSYNWENFGKNAFKIVVDIDEAELKKPTVKPDLAVNSDLAHFIPALAGIDELPDYSKWLKWCVNIKQKYSSSREKEYDHKNSIINPYSFIRLLGKHLGQNEYIITGNASPTVCAFQAFPVKPGQRIITNSGNASMGYDLPAAIGAAIAQKDGKRVICIAGDGSIMMNLQELQTIYHYNLPIKIFIINNGGYSSIIQTQSNFFCGRLTGCTKESGVSTPDFVRIGEAFGIKSMRITNPAKLEEGIAQALAAPGAVLCDVVTDSKQIFLPKLSSEKLADGTMISKPLEDMYPFLDRDEFYSNMITNNFKEQI